MNQFIRLELSDDLIQHEVLPNSESGARLHTEGEVYLSLNHIVYMMVEDSILCFWMQSTGMAVSGLTADYFEFHFSNDQMGEYHRIKRLITVC